MGAQNSVASFQNNDATVVLADERIYNPGDDVSGTVNIERWDMQSEAVTVDLIGELSYTVSFNSVQAQIHKDYDNHVPFFKVSTSFIKHGDKFDLHLDERLPPSMNLLVGTYPGVRYYLQVNLQLASHRQYIIVCPRVSIPRELVHPQHFEAADHKEVHLTGTVERDWVLPGDTLQIQFQIENPQRKRIRYIQVKLVMRGELTKADYFDKILDFDVPNIVDTEQEYIKNSVSLTVPSRYLPPTFIYTNDMHQFRVIISYWITIEMHIKGVFNTITTNIPLSIAFEPENIAFKEQAKPDPHRRITFHHNTKHASQKLNRRFTTQS